MSARHQPAASDTDGLAACPGERCGGGGERGREALDRLRNAIGRVEASWRPASAEEGFEIVRRRLFEPLVEQAQFVARDTVATGLLRSVPHATPGVPARVPRCGLREAYEGRLSHPSGSF